MSAWVTIQEVQRIASSRSFYQLHAKILMTTFHSTENSEAYHTSILLDYVNIDLTRSGRPLGIEVNLPKGKWRVMDPLHIPEKATRGLVFFDPDHVPELDGSYFTNRNRDCLYVRFLEKKEETIQVSDNLLMDVYQRSKLSGIWFPNIRNDFFYVKEMIRHWRLRSGVE